MDRKSGAWRVDLYVFGALAVFFILAYELGQVLTPFIVATLFAYILNPAVNAMTKRGVGRGVAVALFVCMFFIALTGAAALSVYVVQMEVRSLISSLPGYLSVFEKDYLPHVSKYIGLGDEADLGMLVKKVEEHLTQLSPESLQSAGEYSFKFLTGALNVFLAAFNLFLIPVFMAYILYDFEVMKASALDHLPKGYREHIVRKLGEVEGVLRAFAKGQLLVAVIMGVLYCAGLTIAGVEMPILIGMGSGLLNIVPYLGSTIGFVVSTVLVLLAYHDLWHPLYVLIVFGFVQAVEGYVVTPKVVGERLGLHPIVIFLALMVFGDLLGFVGILLAVPIAAVLKVFISGFLRDYKASGLYHGETKKIERP